MTEIWPQQSAQARLRQYQAEFRQDMSNPAQQVYYSRATGYWIVAERARGGQVALTYQTQCPCQG